MLILHRQKAVFASLRKLLTFRLMLKGIIAITGKPGLYKLLKRGKGALIVENLESGKRMPSYSSDKVISLADVTMYADHGDVPLGEVLDSVFKITEGKAVDIKGFAGDDELRGFFEKVLPDYERERVYTTDMRKLFSWYNILLAAGFTEFTEAKTTDDSETEKPAEA